MPEDVDDAGKEGSILQRHEAEAKGHDNRPDLARVDPAREQSISDALDSAADAVACEQSLHAEEVDVDAGGENELVHDNLDSQGECTGCVIEVFGKKHEPCK